MRHQSMNSFVPNWLVSIEFQARSSTTGRFAFGPNTVEPVVSGDEVAAGIADDGHAEFLDLARDVGAKSFCIGEGRPGLEHSGVDGAAEMLEKGAQHAAIEVGARRRSPEEHARRPSRGLRVSDQMQPRTGGEQCTGLAQAREEFASIESGSCG